jgi:hypothetical protein
MLSVLLPGYEILVSSLCFLYVDRTILDLSSLVAEKPVSVAGRLKPEQANMSVTGALPKKRGFLTATKNKEEK